MVGEDAELRKVVDDLPFPLEEYNMSAERKSSFIDIGSGFGKPVFHAAMQTGCYSLGIEIVPARVAFAQDQKYDFADVYQKRLAEKKPALKTAASPSKQLRSSAA
jgi:SAM-dependent methyltransferase